MYGVGWSSSPVGWSSLPDVRRFNGAADVAANNLLHGDFLNQRYGLSSESTLSSPKVEPGDEPLNSASSYYYVPEPSPIDYIDAPLAEAYSMDAATAYQEALSNSSYQRKVADLKKAGLNPVLGLQGSGASVFSGNTANSGATVYSRSGSSSDSSDVDAKSVLETVLPFAVASGVLYLSKSTALSSLASKVTTALLERKK